ncbi:MAG: nicotinate (nicotinamide) nucleotide adenylyltransferase [Lachnospiraceae bacterium]|nr:nicotinate (nicotinamide) nucleotide adenylyltransferase [Lachnospiraceae bacterium]
MNKKSSILKYNCIGILGGTFNPIHNGHIMLAQKAIKQFPDIEKILIMPNNKPAYKGNNEIISPNERITMLKLATSSLDFTEISDIEIKRGGITYSYDTFKEIYGINPNIKIYFIVGADSLYTINKWYKYEDVLKMCTLLVAKRKSGFDEMRLYADKLKKYVSEANIEFINSPNMNISSSAIRKYLGGFYDKNQDISIDKINSYLDKRVPAKVKEYIINNKLYMS